MTLPLLERALTLPAAGTLCGGCFTAHSTWKTSGEISNAAGECTWVAVVEQVHAVSVDRAGRLALVLSYTRDAGVYLVQQTCAPFGDRYSGPWDMSRLTQAQLPESLREHQLSPVAPGRRWASARFEMRYFSTPSPQVEVFDRLGGAPGCAFALPTLTHFDHLRYAGNLGQSVAWLLLGLPFALAADAATSPFQLLHVITDPGGYWDIITREWGLAGGG